MKSIQLITGLALATSLCFVACQPSPHTNPTAADSAALEVRGAENSNSIKLASNEVAELNFKSLMSFEGGKTLVGGDEPNTDDAANSTLVVLYEKNAPWAKSFDLGQFEMTNDEDFDNIMKIYGLKVQKVFNLDTDHDGVVLKPISPLADFKTPGLELSNINHVIMVHLKRNKKE
jgi:hypothetical protein